MSVEKPPLLSSSLATPADAARIFHQIGAELIQKAIRLFYDRAFEDPMIQHFFMHSDKEHLIREQTLFATALLGGPRQYKGLPLEKAHEKRSIRLPHFRRRQILMGEVLTELGLEDELRKEWLRREETLRPLILGEGVADCDHPH